MQVVQLQMNFPNLKKRKREQKVRFLRYVKKKVVSKNKRGQTACPWGQIHHAFYGNLIEARVRKKKGSTRTATFPGIDI